MQDVNFLGPLFHLFFFYTHLHHFIFISTLPEREEEKKAGTFLKMLFYLIIRAIIIITTLFFLSTYVLGAVLNALHMLIHLILTNSMRYVPFHPHFEVRKTEAR